MQHNINMLVYGKDMLYLPYAHYSGGTCIYIIIQMFATNNLKKKAQTQTTYTNKACFHNKQICDKDLQTSQGHT